MDMARATVRRPIGDYLRAVPKQLTISRDISAARFLRSVNVDRWGTAVKVGHRRALR